MNDFGPFSSGRSSSKNLLDIVEESAINTQSKSFYIGSPLGFSTDNV